MQEENIFIRLTPEAIVIKIYTDVVYKFSLKVFILGKFLPLSLMFVAKAGSVHMIVASLR
jgi:hypothetical protein